MNSGQLFKCIQQDRVLQKLAANVYPADKLPTAPTCFIANVDVATKPGSHWIAVFISGDGNGEVFDSYGRAPDKSLETYLKKYCKSIIHNSVRVQGPLSSTCGQYSLYFLCHRARGRAMRNIVTDFGSDFVLNDICVAEYTKRNFDVRAEAYDIKFILSQLCKPEK